MGLTILIIFHPNTEGKNTSKIACVYCDQEFLVVYFKLFILFWTILANLKFRLILRKYHEWPEFYLDFDK
jgi:hypothetical protein